MYLFVPCLCDSVRRNTPSCYRRKRRRMPNTGVRAMRCASCCSTSRMWTGCWARMSAARKRNRSMIASNGHAPKAFRRNAQPHIYVCSKGFRGAAPDKQRAVFAAAEIARKAKWVPLCPACQNCVYEKVYYKLLLLANPLFYGNRKIFVIIMLKLLHFHI